MSTATEISRLQTARNTIRNKMVNLGLGTSTDLLDDLATEIDGITNRGAVSATVQEGDTYTIPAGYHNGSGTVSGVAGGGNYTLQSKSVTPTKSQQSVTADNGYYGLSGVTVNAIPEAYQDVTSVTASAGDVLATKVFVTSSGTVTAGTMPNNGAVSKTLDATTSNQSYTVPSGYHNGSGTVSITLETKSATPTTASQDITPTSGKVLSKVTVNAIPSKFGDTTGDTATASQILSGYKAHTISSGSAVQVTGTIPTKTSSDLTVSGATVTAPSGYYATAASKSVCPTFTIALNAAGTSVSSITCDKTYSECIAYRDAGNTGAFASVAFGTETPSIYGVEYNGYDESGSVTTLSYYVYAGLTVPNIEVKYSSNGNITAVMNPVPENFSSDVTVSGATVTVPWGFYQSQVQKTVASGTAGTPTATKGTVSNHSVTVTPSVTNTTGYITGGTKTGTAVTVTASELASGNKPITSNGTNIDVVGYSTVSVSVSDSVFVITLSKNSNTGYWEPDCTFAQFTAAISAGKTIAVELDLSEQDTYFACNGYNDDGALTYSVFEKYYDETLNEYDDVCEVYQFNGNGVARYDRIITYNTTSGDALAANVLSGKVFYNSTGKVIGSMTNNGAISATINGLTTTSYTVPAGYHSGTGTVSLTNDIENALAAI